MKKNLLLLFAIWAWAGLWAAGQDFSVEFDPADGSQIEELRTFTMTFGQKMVVDWPEAVRVLRNGVEVSEVTCSLSKDGLTATFTLTKPQTEDGTYTFRKLNYALAPAGGAYETPKLSLTYYIGEPQELEPVVSVSPWLDKALSELRDVIIAFENVETIEINPEKAVTMAGPEAEYPYFLTDNSDDEYMMVRAQPANPDLLFTVPGKYILTIEDGALILNGKEYGYSFTFTITQPLEVVSVDPAEGVTTVDALRDIAITFNQELTGFTNFMMKNLKLSLLDDEGYSDRDVATYKATIDADNPCIARLSSTDLEITQTGNYQLVLPPTLFVAGPEKNTLQVLIYTIESLDGIEAALADSDRVDVYSLGGLKLAEGADREALRSLKPGIYIINGKTTLITK